MKIFKILLLSFLPLFTSKLTTAQYTKLLDFSGATNGKYPYGSLISDGTYLYGMTFNGGTSNYGVIFKIKPDGTGYSKLLDFTGGINGGNPAGSLISDGTFLYGMALVGGTYNYGVIFKIKPDGTEYTVLLNFAGTTNGSYPQGSLIFDGTFLYGTTSGGGANDSGAVFKIMPDGTGYTNLFDFAGANGRYPYGALISDGTFLYGMTWKGGANNVGVIFKIKSDGTGYSKLLDFAGVTNGSTPDGSLLSDGTFLYGMTYDGGAYNYGVIFKIKTDGTGYSKLLDFAGATNGSNPYHGSLISDGTFLYGTTHGGGANYRGVIFKIKPDGTGYSKLLDFTGAINGGNPAGSLIFDGTFLYGMTSVGGANDDGVVFKLDIATNIVEKNEQYDFTIYPNPFVMQTTFLTNTFLTNANITVYNAFGQTVKQIKNISGQTFTFYRDNLPSGLYFLQLTNDNKVISADKFVITGK